jgi:hypothetical protein
MGLLLGFYDYKSEKVQMKSGNIDNTLHAGGQTDNREKEFFTITVYKQLTKFAKFYFIFWFKKGKKNVDKKEVNPARSHPSTKCQIAYSLLHYVKLDDPFEYLFPKDMNVAI